MHDTQQIKVLFEKSLPVFDALGDPIRQQLITLMIDGAQRSVAELAAETNVSRSTVSHHLRVLKDAHIIADKKVGRKIFYYPKVDNYFQPVKELVQIVAEIESNTEEQDNG